MREIPLMHTLCVVNVCQGHFCDNGKKCDISPNLPLVSLEMFICGESSPKFQMYNEQKVNGALTREKSKCHN